MIMILVAVQMIVYSDTFEFEDIEKDYQIDRRKLSATYQFAKASQYCWGYLISK